MQFFPGLNDPLSQAELNPKPANWAHQSQVIAEHLAGFSMLLETIQRPLTYRADGGTGIVIVGGGKFWPGIVVGLKLLRSLGDSTPVEIWYRGALEPIRPEDLAGLGPVRLVDSVAYAHANGGARILRGWEQKLFALSHTCFSKCLFLDADAYLVEIPGPLFELLESGPAFQFWQDLPLNDGTVKWAQVWPKGKNGVPQIQGGQLLIDRQRAWKLILLAHWLNQHSDFYYSHGFGDQDTWRIVLAALSQPGLWANLGNAPWVSSAFVVGGPDKIPRIVHRCQGKLFRIADIPEGKQAYNSPRYQLPRETQVFSYLAQFLENDQPQRPELIFGQVYERKLWGNNSGPGSSQVEAQGYIDQINFLIQLGQIKSVVDLGCGDGFIGSNLKVRQYIGADCHSKFIDELPNKYPGRQWLKLDFYHDRDLIPESDWLLCKDVLHHWPNRWVIDFLTWLSREMAKPKPKWRLAIFTQDKGQPSEPTDCHLGGYRALNKAQFPLNQFRLRSIGQYLHKELLALELA
jgi:hypothetical protein